MSDLLPPHTRAMICPNGCDTLPVAEDDDEIFPATGRSLRFAGQYLRYLRSKPYNKPTTLQALLMTGAGMVNNRVLAEKGSHVEQLLAGGISNEQIIQDMFLTSLARRPTPAELEVALAAFEKDRKQGAEDVQWALINGIEFIVNH